MDFVADESLDFGIIRNLRTRNFNIISILEEFSGISDIDALKIAARNDCVLITEDKDFGELTYRLNMEHTGILLIRLGDLPRTQRLTFATEIIEKHFEDLKGNFSVLDSKGLRIKKKNRDKS